MAFGLLEITREYIAQDAAGCCIKLACLELTKCAVPAVMVTCRSADPAFKYLQHACPEPTRFQLTVLRTSGGRRWHGTLRTLRVLQS